MTSASEVHLFTWIHENLEWIGGLLVLWGALMTWGAIQFFKARDAKGASAEALASCILENTKEHARIEGRQDVQEKLMSLTLKEVGEIKALVIDYIRKGR